MTNNIVHRLAVSSLFPLRFVNPCAAEYYLNVEVFYLGTTIYFNYKMTLTNLILRSVVGLIVSIYPYLNIVSIYLFLNISNYFSLACARIEGSI